MDFYPSGIFLQTKSMSWVNTVIETQATNTLPVNRGTERPRDETL